MGLYNYVRQSKEAKNFIEKHIEIIDNQKYNKLIRLMDESLCFESATDVQLFLEEALDISLWDPYGRDYTIKVLDNLIYKFINDKKYECYSYIDIEYLLLFSHNSTTIGIASEDDIYEIICDKKSYFESKYNIMIDLNDKIIIKSSN